MHKHRVVLLCGHTPRSRRERSGTRAISRRADHAHPIANADAQRLAELADDPIADIFTVAKDGSASLGTIPDVRTLDYIKRGVDAVSTR